MVNLPRANASEGDQRRADDWLHRYVRDPNAPQAEEVQRFLLEVAAQQAQLESDNQQLRHQQRQLEAYRDRYIDLYDFAPLGYVTLDEDGYVQEINLAGASLLGAERDGLIGYPLAPYVVAEDQAAFSDHVHKCVRESREVVSELRLAASGGRTPVVQLRSIPLADPKTEVALCKTAMTDITERKSMEQRLARLNQFKEQLLGPNPLNEKLKLITDVVIEVFQADFARIWVIREGDLCERGCQHASVAEGPDICRHRDECLHLVASSGRYTSLQGSHRRVPLGCYKIGRVALGEEPKFVTNDVTHDPRVHDHEWAASLGLASFAGYRLLSPEGTPLGVLAAFSSRPIGMLDDALLEDLAHTASQVIRTGMAEETLRMTQFAVDHAGDAAFWLGSDARFVYANLKACEYLGYSRDELLTMTVHDIDPDYPAETWRTHWEELRRRGSYTFQSRHRTKDGRLVPVEIAVNYLSYEGRELNCAFVRDITERKRIEEEVHEAQQRILELQQHEKELVEADLRQVRDTLVRQTRLAAVGQLSASIAHELRNPLGTIRGAADLIQRTLCPKESPCQEYLTLIRDETAVAGEIITDCMALSRGRPPSKSPVALATILEKARCQVDAPDAIEWHWAFSEPFMVHGDAPQLEQVLRNLFCNAVQALGPAGRITVAATHGDEWDEVRVSDTGPGIPVELRDQVFEPLVTSKSRGTGLGLTICRQIIEQHGGTIELLADSTAGTTFRIRLPIGCIDLR